MFGGVGFGPAIAGGANIMFGLTSTGVLTISVQGSGDPVGVGAYAGVGLQGGVNYNWNPTAANQNGDWSLSAQIDGNAGIGIDSAGGSIGISPDGIGGVGAVRYGFGGGLLVSAGVSATKTWTWNVPESVFPWNWHNPFGSSNKGRNPCK